MRKILAVLFSILLVCSCGAILSACGEPPHEHSYTSYVYNNDAKCGLDGTEIATCDNGCGESHTRTKVGSALEHNYVLNKHNEAYHWEECSCGEKINQTTHSYTWKGNEQIHWEECSCGEKTDKEEHVGNGSQCETCNYTYTFTEGIIYDKSADGTYVEVIGYSGTDTFVRIASTYDNLPVKTIYNDAFGGTDIKKVIIPESVTSIGSSAFRGCKSLTSIVIGDSVTSIGEYAFYDCDLLIIKVNYLGTIDSWVQIEFGNMYSNPVFYAKNLYINNELVTEAKITSATKINAYAFDYCTSLKVIEIPDSVTSIGGAAFRGCTSLKAIEIPDSVTSIGGGAFSDCTSLETIEIGDSVTSIGDGAFLNCSKLFTEKNYIKYVRANGNDYYIAHSVSNTNLSTYTIDSTTKILGGGVFYGCSRLTSIEIPDSVTSIGEYAFDYCTSLIKVNYLGTIDSWVQIEFDSDDSNPLSYAKNLYINNELVTEAKITSATKINDYAFSCCESLTSVVIGDSVTSIGDDAFSHCESLTSVVIGDSVTSIGEYAFFCCTSLEAIEIGDSVTSIGDDGFCSCTSLEAIVIGDSVTSIGYWAFDRCWSLTIYCEAESKPSGWDSDWNSSNRPVVWGYKG